MIVDSSALLCLVNGEAESEDVMAALLAADSLAMSAATWVEVFTVADRRDPALAARLESLLAHLGVVVEPVTMEQAALARRASRDFGKGRHRAGLNFGDSFSYALARTTDEDLLFVGDDFTHTDLRSALTP